MIDFSLANKQDVKGALDEIDVCEKLRIEDMVNLYKIPCKVVSGYLIKFFPNVILNYPFAHIVKTHTLYLPCRKRVRQLWDSARKLILQLRMVCGG